MLSGLYTPPCAPLPKPPSVQLVRSTWQIYSQSTCKRSVKAISVTLRTAHGPRGGVISAANGIPEELLTLVECMMTPELSTVTIQHCLIRVFRQDGVPWSAWSCYMKASTSPVTPIYTIFGHGAQKNGFFIMSREFAKATPLQTSCVPSDAEMSRQEAGGRHEAASGF